MSITINVQVIPFGNVILQIGSPTMPVRNVFNSPMQVQKSSIKSLSRRHQAVIRFFMNNNRTRMLFRPLRLISEYFE